MNPNVNTGMSPNMNASMDPNVNTHVRVGLITKVHGVRGEVSVAPLTDDKRRFELLDRVYIEKRDLSVEADCEIEYVRFHNDKLHLKFNGRNTVEEVTGFIGKYISIDESERIKLPDDNYYIYELLDCEVFDLSGELLGVVSDVLETGCNDVYVVKPDGGTRKDVLLPAIKSVIKDVSVKDKKIIVDYSPEGG